MKIAVARKKSGESRQALTEPILAESLVDKLTARLEEAILSGDLQPGGRLSEQGLALQFGVSRSPLREALRRLEGRKLVWRTPNLGVHVAEQSVDDLRELLITREALEGMACRHAATEMTDQQLSDLAGVLNQHGGQRGIREGSAPYLATFDISFHFRIIEGSGNQRLIAILCKDLYDQLRLYRYKVSGTPGRPRRSFEEHTAVLEALLKRDPDAAEVTMRQHIASAREVALDRVSSQISGKSHK